MAVDSHAVELGDERALFKSLITLAMFQRLKDTLVAQILRSLPQAEAEELTDAGRLYLLASGSGCPHTASQESLLKVCDLTKDPVSRLGKCSVNQSCSCYLKRHTVLLRRYGHFGKMPTSAALALYESWGGSFLALRTRIFQEHGNPLARAKALEVELSRVWRVDKKVACMFLSAISAPNLGLKAPPWEEGMDWTWFLPIDVNIDKFLLAVGWTGPWTYEARRQAILSISKEIPLGSLKAGLRDYNPRFVLQAINRFMSRPNRREAISDCSRLAPASCADCPTPLAAICPLRVCK
jgi:hypothetical protein